jgi:chromosome segregation ATPase
MEAGIRISDHARQRYAERIVAKITTLRAAAEEARSGCETECGDAEIKVLENEERIAILRKEIKDLEALNEGYRNVIIGLKSKANMASDELREYINRLFGTRVY